MFSEKMIEYVIHFKKVGERAAVYSMTGAMGGVGGVLLIAIGVTDRIRALRLIGLILLVNWYQFCLLSILIEKWRILLKVLLGNDILLGTILLSLAKL